MIPGLNVSTTTVYAKRNKWKILTPEGWGLIC